MFYTQLKIWLLNFIGALLIFGTVNGATVNIECKQLDSHFWTPLGHIQTCEDKPSTLTTCKAGIKVASVMEPEETEIEEPSDIEGLYIEGAKNLRYMPRCVKKHLPNIKAIAVWHSGLIHLTKDDFEDYGKNLIYAGFRGCKIETIESDLFVHNPKLKMIRLDRNPIKHIESGFFEHLHKLCQIEHIRLTESECIDQNYCHGMGKIGDFKWQDEKCRDDHFSGSGSGDIEINSV